MTPPILSITGEKNAGKTTLVVRLAAALTQRGVRVMTIKHGSHTFDIDPDATDTFRHYHEGRAVRVAMVSPDKFALVMHNEESLAPEQIAQRFMADADIVLCEGYKHSGLPKIEIHRHVPNARMLYDPALSNASAWQALVSDGDVPGLPFPVFRLDHAGWLDELVLWVLHRFLPHRS